MATGDIIENMNEAEKSKVAPLNSARWLAEIKTADKNTEKWHETARVIVKRYLDRRGADTESQNKINLFTTNTNILISTLYAKFPKPIVTREYEDQDDDVARVSGILMERMLTVRPNDDFDSAIRYVVQDRLVAGMGTVWMRYDPTIEKKMSEEVLDDMGVVIQEAAEYEAVVDERVATDYVYWEDIIFSPGRTWEDLRWVARRVKMVKIDVEKRFGEAIATQVTFSKSNSKSNSDSDMGPEHDDLQYAEVFEIWCKRTKKVYWVTPGFDLVLDQKPDILGLSGFFPTPRFATAMTSTSNYMPRPDYLMAKDQYEELDEVNNRITWLERAIRVVGVYDGNNAEVERIFTEGFDNKIIPSRSFREFAEKGGFRGAIDWFPIEAIVNALDKLRSYRQDLITQIYDITGISDIMRGSSKASETLGAQQLKAQYGSVKLQHLQMEIANFVAEAFRIKSEIIRAHFMPETVIRVTNIDRSVDAQYKDEAVQLMFSPEYEFRVEVHADSMAIPEFNAERDARLGFLRAIAEMLTSAAPIIEKDPAAGITMLKLAQWAAASFRTARTAETIFDEAIKGIQKSLSAPKEPPPPNVELERIKAQVGIAAGESKNRMAINAADNLVKLKIASMSSEQT